jgi:hypothetical protein
LLIGASGKNAVLSNERVWRLTFRGFGVITQLVWIAIKALRARALVAAGQVSANRIQTASRFSVLSTFINVATLLRDIVSRMTLNTYTNVYAARTRNTLFTARTWVLVVALDNFPILDTTALIRIARRSAAALACIAANVIVANSTWSAWIVFTLDHIDTGTSRVNIALFA